ncbi:fukutin-like isoform X2 [Thrips palmi]|uniref:Fukutin-like isoform X2 n=1 Tax=Thrips palmi TaxID=161013 RepID=A0A6P8YIU0_THRPL|nr:fukutin-like isoform X2 [Thrips palmi]
MFRLRPSGKKLLLVSCVFLLAQAFVYMGLAFIGGNHRVPSLLHERLVSVTGQVPRLNISISEKFLQEGQTLDFVIRAEGCTPFIISPKILAHVWNVKQNILDCVGGGADCRLDGDDVFLAVDSSCIPKKVLFDEFVKKLEVKGFSVYATQSKKIFGLPPKASILTTALVLRKNYSFLVVILHGREDNFWWHGSVHDDLKGNNYLKKVGILLSRQHFMATEGAIPKFDLVDAQLLEYHFLVPKDIPAFLRAISDTSSNFIECDYKRADTFFRTHGRDQSITAIRFKHQAWKMLSRAKRILDDLEVPFWLSSGTCLGFLRQCDFIPYSQDVDLGVFASDYKEEIIPAFLSHGFKLHHTFGKANDSYQIAFEYKKLKLDIFFFYVDEEKGTMWNGGTEARSGQKYRYTFTAFSLCWTEFLELLVRVPCNTRRYIEANYGLDWFTPVTKWSWKSSPPNVEKNGVWPKEEWAKVINIPG